MNTVDIAFVTIIQEEYEAVLRRLENPGFDHAVNQNLYSWQLGTITSRHRPRPYQVVLAYCGEPTQVPGAFVVQETVERYKPSCLVLVGVAGSLRADSTLEEAERVELGDVVVSTLIHGYEYGKIDDGRFVPRTDLQYEVSGHLRRSAGTLPSDLWVTAIGVRPPHETAPKRVSGPVLSGNKVVDDPTDSFFREVMLAYPKAIAVEMEGAGAGHALRHLADKGISCSYLMVRGISDRPRGNEAAGTETQKQQRDTWKPYAANAAAAFAVALVRHQWPLAPRKRPSTGRTVAPPFVPKKRHSQRQLTVAAAIDSVNSFYGSAPSDGPLWYRINLQGKWLPTGVIGYPHWVGSRALETVTFEYRHSPQEIEGSSKPAGTSEAVAALETVPVNVRERCIRLQEWYSQRGEILWNDPAYVIQFEDQDEAIRALASGTSSTLRLSATGWATYRLGCGLVLDELAFPGAHELPVRSAIFPSLPSLVRGHPARIGGVNVLTALAFLHEKKLHWSLGFAMRSAENAVFPESLSTVPSGTHAPISSDYGGGAAISVSVWREFAEEFNFTDRQKRPRRGREVPFNPGVSDPYWFADEYESLRWFFRSGPKNTFDKPEQVVTKLTSFAISAANGLYGFNVLMCVLNPNFYERFRVAEHWEAARRIVVDTDNSDHPSQIAKLLTGRNFAPPAIPALVEGLKALKEVDKEHSNTLRLPDIESEFARYPS